MTQQPPITATNPKTGISAPLPGIDTTPLPLAGRTPPPEFPADALGDLLGNAAKALAYHVQTPLGMAGQSVLAVTSLAVQGHVNIGKGNLGTSPTTLYCLTIAASGERKSSLDSLAMKPIYEYQAERRAEYENLLADYRAEMEAHELRHKSIVTAYKGKGKNQRPLSDDDQQALQAELAELERNQPTPPPRPHILMEEPTAEGIYRHLQEGEPVAGLFSDEGGGFFSGHGMEDEAKGRSITMLSQLWDAKTITRTRAGAGESGILAGRRLAAHLMLQPIIADKVLSDPLMMGQGFLARFLICSGESLVGQRLLADRPDDESAAREPAVTRFWDAIAELIRQPLPINDAGELEPEALAITGPAYDAWKALHDQIEQQMAPAGEYAGIKPFAAKAADNAARIAAVLSYAESRTEPTAEHIVRAAELIDYYLTVMVLRTQEATQHTAEHEAREVAEWIRQKGGKLRADDFKKLPAAYRKAPKARALLKLLVDYGHAVVTQENRKGEPSEWRMIEGPDNA
ncbi:YfjI family protein [Halomonas sp.]|uniref:YfjI family protein n=1 Tax=Halomonas sp. TaxID=1486246 RepID=UPI0035679CC4